MRSSQLPGEVSNVVMTVWRLASRVIFGMAGSFLVAA
jgi:hypothetical protein